MKLALNLLILILGFLVNDCHGLMCEKENFLGITSYMNCPGTFDNEDAKFCCGTDSNRYCCSNPLGLSEKDLEELTESSSKRFHRWKRSPNVTSTEPPINEKTLVTQEGFRDGLKHLKDKVKEKVNGTVSGVKGKVKQKVKDKITKKVEEKLDPTGGYMKLPTILGILFAGAIALIVLCIVCCCCCPFCLLHKRRNRGIVHNPVPAAAQMQPVMASPPVQANYAPVQSGPYPQPQYPPPQGYMPQPGYGAPAGAPYPMPPQPYPPQAGGDNPPPYAEKQMAYNPNY